MPVPRVSVSHKALQMKCALSTELSRQALEKIHSKPETLEEKKLRVMHYIYDKDELDIVLRQRSDALTRKLHPNEEQDDRENFDPKKVKEVITTDVYGLTGVKVESGRAYMDGVSSPLKQRPKETAEQAMNVDFTVGEPFPSPGHQKSWSPRLKKSRSPVRSDCISQPSSPASRPSSAKPSSTPFVPPYVVLGETCIPTPREVLASAATGPPPPRDFTGHTGLTPQTSKPCILQHSGHQEESSRAGSPQRRLSGSTIRSGLNSRRGSPTKRGVRPQTASTVRSSNSRVLSPTKSWVRMSSQGSPTKQKAVWKAWKTGSRVPTPKQQAEKQRAWMAKKVSTDQKVFQWQEEEYEKEVRRNEAREYEYQMFLEQKMAQERRQKEFFRSQQFDSDHMPEQRVVDSPQMQQRSIQMMDSIEGQELKEISPSYEIEREESPVQVESPPTKPVRKCEPLDDAPFWCVQQALNIVPQSSTPTPGRHMQQSISPAPQSLDPTPGIWRETSVQEITAADDGPKKIPRDIIHVEIPITPMSCMSPMKKSMAPTPLQVDPHSSRGDCSSRLFSARPPPESRLIIESMASPIPRINSDVVVTDVNSHAPASGGRSGMSTERERWANSAAITPQPQGMIKSNTGAADLERPSSAGKVKSRPSSAGRIKSSSAPAELEKPSNISGPPAQDTISRPAALKKATEIGVQVDVEVELFPWEEPTTRTVRPFGGVYPQCNRVEVGPQVPKKHAVTRPWSAQPTGRSSGQRTPQSKMIWSVDDFKIQRSTSGTNRPNLYSKHDPGFTIYLSKNNVVPPDYGAMSPSMNLIKKQKKTVGSKREWLKDHCDNRPEITAEVLGSRRQNNMPFGHSTSLSDVSSTRLNRRYTRGSLIHEVRQHRSCICIQAR